MVGITVMCPNSRRQLVKIEPATQLRSALEEACLKEGYDVDEYQLIYRNRSLDLSLPFRLSGLPNNVVVDMKPVARPDGSAEADVALQISDGRRKCLKLPISCSLLDVLCAFCKEFEADLIKGTEENVVPSCVYMNKEYRGEDMLKETTLKSMGISGGSRICIRCNMVKLSSEELAELEKRAEEEVSRKRKLLAGFDAKKAENEKREQLAQAREEAYERELKARAEERERTKAEALRQESPRVTAEAGGMSDFAPRMGSDVGEEQNANPSVASSSRLERLKTLLTQVDTSLNSNMEDFLSEQLLDESGRLRMEPVVAFGDQSVTANEFANFKFPDTPLQASATSSLVATGSVGAVNTSKCERAAILFSHADAEAENATSDEAALDEGDEFFELSTSDAQKLQRELREQASSERLLIPKAFIEQRNRQLKLEAFGHAVIRFVFQNGKRIQACFNSCELVCNLYEFVTDCISEKSRKFTLSFGLNQKIEQDSGKNLIDIGAAPSSRIYVTFRDNSALNYDNLFLAERLTVGSRQEADSLSRKWLSTNRMFKPFKPAASSNNGPRQAPLGHSEEAVSRSEPAKNFESSPAPRWFKKL